MKIILFSDCKIIPAFDGKEVILFNTNSTTITNALNYIENENPDLILIYAELIFNWSKRIESKGIELIKHIRLTPLNNNLQNSPIILFHWLPIENYIESNLENLIVYSPGIKRIILPSNIFSFATPKYLSENISQFLFNSSNDEKLSDHAFRNEIAISQFEADVKLGENDFKNKPIWYKKLFYKQGYSLNTTTESKLQINHYLKILLIDDMGKKWKTALLKVLPKADIFVCETIFDAKKKIKEMNDSVASRRNDFAEKVTDLLSTSCKIEDKKEEAKTVFLALQNAKNSLESAKRALSNEGKIIESKTNELHSLLKELTQNNGLFEVLIDFKTEDINVDTKQKVNKLSGFISDISNSKEKIKEIQRSIIENGKKNSDYDLKMKRLDSELNTLISNQRVNSNDASNLFESLFNTEYNLVLLDMHLTKDSEGKSTAEMDGFQILEELQNTKLKLPTAIFSATTKRVDHLKNTFKFLQQNQFIKGITPVEKFSLIINELDTASCVNRLTNIIDEVIAFSIFKFREYDDYDSKSYFTKQMNQKERFEIIGKLNTIKTLLESYSTDKNVTNLKTIILIFGNIQRDYRFRVIQSNYVKGYSLLYKQNCVKNLIKDNCVDLHDRRNDIEHEKDKVGQYKNNYEEWCKKLNLNLVDKYLNTVYKGLIFDE